MTRITDTTDRLTAAEIVAHAATLLALVQTQMLAAYLPEANPVARAYFESVGYAGAAVIAIGGVAAVFALYRRLDDDYPRIATAGGVTVAGVAVGDAAWASWNLLTVSGPESVAWPILGEILAAGVCALALVAALSQRTTVRRWISAPRRVFPQSHHLRRGAASAMALLLVSSAVAGLVAFGGSSPVGEATAASGDVVYTSSLDNTVKRVYASNATVDWTFSGHSGQVQGVSVGPNGEAVYSASDDNTLKRIDSATGSSEWTHSGFTSGVKSVAVNADGLAFGGDADGDVEAVDTSDGSQAWTKSLGSNVQSLVATDDGDTVIAGLFDGTVVALSTTDGSQQWSTSVGEVNDMSIGPAGETVYVADAGTEDIVAKYTANGSTDWTSSVGSTGGAVVAAGPDGNWVFGGGNSDTLYKLDAADGSQDWTNSYAQNIDAVGTTNDGTTVFAGLQDGTIDARQVSDNTQTWNSAVHSSDVSEIDGSYAYTDTPSSENTVTVQVTDQNGQPVSDARVEAWAVNYDNLDSGLSSTEKDEKANELLQNASNLVPRGWSDQSETFDLASRATSYSGLYAAVYSEDQANPTNGAIWGDSADVSSPEVQVEADEKLYLTAWDASKESAIETGEYNSQMPGKVQEDKQITVEALDGTGDVVRQFQLSTDKVHKAGGIDIGNAIGNSELYYATTRLPTGYYRVYAGDNEEAAYYIRVGDPESQFVADLEDDVQNSTDSASNIADQAQNIRNNLTDGTFTRQVAYTNESGYATIEITDDSLDTLGIQATKLSGLNMTTFDAGLNRTEQYENVQGTLLDESHTIYLPSRVKRVTLPAGGTVDITTRSLSWPTLGNASDLQHLFDDWLSNQRDDMLSTLNGTLQDRFGDLRGNTVNRTEMEQVYQRLNNLSRENEALRDKYRKLLKRFEARQQNNSVGDLAGTNTTEALNRTVTLDLNVSDASDQQLQTRVAALEQAIELLHSQTPTDSESETNSDSVDATFQFDDRVAAENLVVYANKDGSRTLVDDEYLSVEQTGVGPFGGTTVRVEDYPVGAADASLVTFTARAVTNDGDLAKGQTTTQNPGVSAEPPTFDAIRLSSQYPAPNGTATLTVVPGDSTTFGALQGVTAYHPNGTELGAGLNSSRQATIETADPGIYVVELTMTPAGSTTSFTESVRVRVANKRSDQNTVRLATGRTGTFAVVAGGIQRASIDETDAGIDVTAYATDDGVPDEVHVYTTGLGVPAESQTTVSVLTAEGQTPDERTRVITHTQAVSGDAVLYRVGSDGDRQPLVINGETQWGVVETRNGGMVIRSATTETGTLTLEVNNNPGVVDSTLYEVRKRIGPLDVPVLTLPTIPTTPMPALPSLTVGLFLIVGATGYRRE